MVVLSSEKSIIAQSWSETHYSQIQPALEGYLIKIFHPVSDTHFHISFSHSPTTVTTELAYVYIGCKDGSVWIYCQDVLIKSFTHHTASIVYICVQSDRLITVSEDGVICISSLQGELKSRLITGKTASCAYIHDSLCILGEYEISVYHLVQQRIVNTYTGHTSRINSLSVYNDLIVSSAQEDRSITVWSENERILTCDSPIILSSSSQNGQVLGVSEEGKLFVWDISAKPIIKKKKSPATTLVPDTTLSINLDGEPTSIISATFVPEGIMIVYGKSKTRFEIIKADENEKIASTTLTRSTQPLITPKDASKPSKVSIASSIPIEKSFSEIILDQTTTESVIQKPNAASLSILLQQALSSNDSILLQQAFNVSQPPVITSTLERLPPHQVPILLQILAIYLSKPNRISTLIVWLKSLLSVHSSLLMTHPQLLQKIQNLLKVRVESYQSMHQLFGKLELVLGYTTKSHDVVEMEGNVYNEDDDEQMADDESFKSEEEYNEDFDFDSDVSGDDELNDDRSDKGDSDVELDEAELDDIELDDD